jgi:fatty-acyl-CoA synthase
MSDAAPRPRSGTLGDLLDEIAAATPDAPAVVFRAERLDYAGLKARADGFARALLAAGVRRGDRMGLLVTNRSEWLVAAFGAAKIGAVTAAISTFSTPRELSWALEHCGASVLVTLDAFRGRLFLGTLSELCPELARSAAGALRSAKLPALRTIIVVQGAARWQGCFPLPISPRAAAVSALQTSPLLNARCGPRTSATSSIPRARPRHPRA